MINSVVKAINILTLLNECDRGGLTLVELAEKSGITVPTAFNLLGTLEAFEYVERDLQTKRYRLGRAACSLGRSSGTVEKLVDIAMPFMRELRNALSETVILTAYEFHKRNTIISLESSLMLRVSAQMGKDKHLYNTATGRIMLSMLNDTALESVWQDLGAPGDLWKEVKDFDGLKAELAEINSAGHSLFITKNEIRALAVPLRLNGCQPLSIGAFYPVSRFPDGTEIPKFLENMRKAADAIAAKWNGAGIAK